MFYPVKIYSGEEIKSYVKSSGDMISSKIKPTKKGKILSTKKLDKEYWNEFENQEDQLKEMSMGLVVEEQKPSVPYNDKYYE